MATRNQYDATRQELSDTWQPIVGAFNFTYTALAGFPRLLLHHDGSLYVLAAVGSIMRLRPEYQINDGAWVDSGWGVDGLKRTFPNGFDGTIPMQCNRPCFPGAYPAGTTIRTRMMAQCSGSVVLCDSNLIPQAEAVKTWTQSESHQWNEAEDDVVVIPDMVFALEAENIGSAAETGNIFGEENRNRQFLEIEGNRFVWAGSRRPGGEFAKAQTVVGSATEDGAITYGVLSEDVLGWNNALSSNTYCVCAIGNNKFARYTTGNEGFGFLTWDCGASGLSASLLADNHLNGVNTVLPGGFRDCILHSAGKMYLVSGKYPPDYSKHKLQICDISNSTGVTYGLVEVDEVFGAGKTINYSGSEQGEMQGRAIPGGGAMWVIRRAGTSSPYATDMQLMVANVASVDLHQCADLDGSPLALSIADDGVFTFAYLTTDNKISVRVGKLTGFVPTFGDSFDIYEGATGQDLFPADMGYIGDGKFLFSVQNWNTNKTDNITFESDGSTVVCSNTSGSALSVSTAGANPLMIAQSGDAGKLLVGELSGSTGRRTKMVGLATDPVTLTGGISASVTVDLEKYKYYAIYAPASVASVDVTLSGLTADLDLFVKAGSKPNSPVNDGSSENGGTDSENVVVANTGDTAWYIGVYGYAAGSGTLTATLS